MFTRLEALDGALPCRAIVHGRSTPEDDVAAVPPGAATVVEVSELVVEIASGLHLLLLLLYYKYNIYLRGGNESQEAAGGQRTGPGASRQARKQAGKQGRL